LDISGCNADFYEGDHCRRIAGRRHGICELTRNGMTE
jgi:hypothetical protein